MIRTGGTALRRIAGEGSAATVRRGPRAKAGLLTLRGAVAGGIAVLGQKKDGPVVSGWR